MKNVEDYVYIINRLGMMDSGELADDPRFVKAKIVVGGDSDLAKTVTVVAETGPGVTQVFLVRGEPDVYIRIGNPDNLPFLVLRYLKAFGIRWKPY